MKHPKISHHTAVRALGMGMVLAVALLSAGCGSREGVLLQGYVEGEYVYVAAPLPGALEKLSVKRGDYVEPGAPLFALEAVSEKAALDEARRRLSQATATLEDAKKGRRPTELASLEAQRGQARAAMTLSSQELARQQKLVRSGATSREDLDKAASTHEQNSRRVDQLEADIQTAKLGQRVDQVAAAEAEVQAREAAVVKAEWDLSQKQQRAAQGGVVSDTLYREGEWVAAGRPVVALLPPGNVKVRVFVPEPELGGIRQGDRMEVTLDGVNQKLGGTVSFISPKAEYTPPVIYSRESRSKLVYMIELVFDARVAASLHPGQPVDVHLGSGLVREG